MKKVMITLVLVTGFVMTSFAQTTWQETWKEMSKEEKMMQLQKMREDNQHYLKYNLGMTDAQRKSIDSVNQIYMDGLNKIEKSTGTDDEKLAKAQEITKQRGTALDAIMGAEKHKKFSQYVYAKLQKAEDNK
jgi:flagellar biosynthesis protein FliP